MRRGQACQDPEGGCGPRACLINPKSDSVDSWDFLFVSPLISTFFQFTHVSEAPGEVLELAGADPWPLLCIRIPWRLAKHMFPGPTPRTSDSEGLGWGLRIRGCS